MFRMIKSSIVSCLRPTNSASASADPTSTSGPWRRFMSGTWMIHGKTNEELINGMSRLLIINSPAVKKAMLAVPREHYVRNKSTAYSDSPQPIGYGATISAPHMHAQALEVLHTQLKPGAKVLDVGSGSGYLAACMSKMVSGNGGRVFGIDVIPELVEWSIENVKRSDPQLLESGVLNLRVGDGWKGLPDEAPFDAIHVGAAAATLPTALVDQLKPGGRMVVPIGTITQRFVQLDKSSDGKLVQKDLFGVAYVPLVKK